MARTRELPKTAAKKKSGERNKAEGMELPEFVTEYRRRVQGYLWEREDKITVADLVRLAELERETQKYSERKRPRELRVTWINQNKSTT